MKNIQDAYCPGQHPTYCTISELPAGNSRLLLTYIKANGLFRRECDAYVVLDYLTFALGCENSDSFLEIRFQRCLNIAVIQIMPCNKSYDYPPFQGNWLGISQSQERGDTKKTRQDLDPVKGMCQLLFDSLIIIMKIFIIGK